MRLKDRMLGWMDKQEQLDSDLKSCFQTNFMNIWIPWCSRIFCTQLWPFSRKTLLLHWTVKLRNPENQFSSSLLKLTTIWKPSLCQSYCRKKTKIIYLPIQFQEYLYYLREAMQRLLGHFQVCWLIEQILNRYKQ